MPLLIYIIQNIFLAKVILKKAQLDYYYASDKNNKMNTSLQTYNGNKINDNKTYHHSKKMNDKTILYKYPFLNNDFFILSFFDKSNI